MQPDNPRAQTREQVVAEITAGYESEEAWARRTGREIRPCRDECDFGRCAGWMIARPRSEAEFYGYWNAEELIAGTGEYHAPYLWERNR